jgi:CRP-like cAMP-binding protein
MRAMAGQAEHKVGGTAAREEASAGELTAIPFLSGLPAEVARRHTGAARWVTAGAGQQILAFDDASDDVFFVLTGCVRVVVRTPGGRELILDDIPAGRFFGEMSAIDAAPRSASVTALYRSRICRMPGRVFMSLLAEAPPLARDMMRLLVGRIRAQNSRLLELTTLDIRHRLHAELLRLAAPAGPDGTRLISPPPVQQVLAQRIGARREPVSREIARLLREGILERRRGALVLRRPAVLEGALAALLDS